MELVTGRTTVRDILEISIKANENRGCLLSEQ
jgi:hypothetical protein